MDLTGIYEDRSFIVTRGDARIAMTIAKNADTVKFGRQSRFLIDDDDRVEKAAYTLTKPLKIGKTYNSKGVYSFVLQESVSTKNDNMELGIADYYLHFPESEFLPEPEPDAKPEVDPDIPGKKVWL